MTTDQKPPLPPKNNNISISGDVRDSNVIIGDNNTVNQTIIQKFFNIFKSDTETLEQRNRRILLGHVENAWIKGVLDASLHGAALLDLGIKQDLEAVTQYPWVLKKESTNETLPTGTSMLEIFDSIGMGRSLLILGAPGSGKTTMLLELARGLIARAREDVTQPIPMVFNLASWTEKFSLADWLAQELNNLYSVPRKTAPDWVKGNKLLLLLDGLDEVRQDSRAKCVDTINEFRKQNGLTSLCVCSRSQDYADLNAKLSFEGAIEVQPLSQRQIVEFFNRFGDEMAGIKQALEKDSALREMAETPLFLSIMLMAYRDKRDVDIWLSKDENKQRKHLFDNYIQRMFERRIENTAFKKRSVLHWLSYLADNMITYSEIPYLLEKMQPEWLNRKNVLRQYYIAAGFVVSAIIGIAFTLNGGILTGLIAGFLAILGVWRYELLSYIQVINSLKWEWKLTKRIFVWSFGLTLFVELLGLISTYFSNDIKPIDNIVLAVVFAETLLFTLSLGVFLSLIVGLVKQLEQEQLIVIRNEVLFSIQNSLIIFALSMLSCWVLGGTVLGLSSWSYFRLQPDLSNNFPFFYSIKLGLSLSIGYGLLAGLFFGLLYGGLAVIQHYILRFLLARNNLLPWRLVPFLDHCVDLIFLRRVGGGYIFIHRLLMEHFAEMYVESSTSKGY